VGLSENLRSPTRITRKTMIQKARKIFIPLRWVCVPFFASVKKSTQKALT
jgi:hypothetical protein